MLVPVFHLLAPAQILGLAVTLLILNCLLCPPHPLYPRHPPPPPY